MGESRSGVVLLETVGVRNGVAPLWPLHLERLARSSNNLGLVLPASIPAPRGGGDHIVRYAISSQEVKVSGRQSPLLEGIDLVSLPLVHQGYPDKTAAREWLDLALTTARSRGGGDALLGNAAGQVVEAVNWAIGWWSEDGLVFPPLTLGGLRSVSRRRIAELVQVQDGRVRLADLGGKALIAANAARGVVPVTSLDGVPLPADQRTADLQARFWERVSA